MYNIITTPLIVQNFKKSVHWKRDLGRALSVQKSEGRSFQINPEEKFMDFYKKQYNVVLISEGHIGKIRFFSDHYLREPVIAFYDSDFREFIFDYNEKEFKSQTIESYLGSMIKEIELGKEKEVQQPQYEPIGLHEDPESGDADKLFKNPGSVTYDDLKKYLQQKRRI